MHQDVQRTEAFFDLLEEFGDALDLADVSFDDQRTPPERFDLTRGFLGRRPVAEEVDDHVRAVPCEVQRDGASDAASGAGYEGDLVLEWGHGIHLWGCVLGEYISSFMAAWVCKKEDPREEGLQGCGTNNYLETLDEQSQNEQDKSDEDQPEGIAGNCTDDADKA